MLRRLPWEKMEAEGLTRAILWNSLRPTLLDWLELVSPSTTLMGLAFDDEKGGELGGGPVGRSLRDVRDGAFRHLQGVVCRQCAPWREAVRWIFETWTLEALLAAFPASYRHLRAFMDALGFTPWPERLPKACHMPTPGNRNVAKTWRWLSCAVRI